MALPVVTAALFAVGCPESSPPAPGLDGDTPPADAGTIDPTQDTDGDGLCDTTEIQWGTLVEDPDSDDDGLNDWVERILGFDAFDPGSPTRELLVFLTENEASSAQLPILRAVRGEGETYAGAFMELPIADRLGVTAREFFEGAYAVGAMPAENVYEIHEEDQVFVGVTGRTQLYFEVRFAYGDAVDRGCGRVYPFRYDIRREDGATVYARRFILVVLPRGQRLDTVEWCVPEGGCL
jgi:hypothetical protein